MSLAIMQRAACALAAYSDEQNQWREPGNAFSAKQEAECSHRLFSEIWTCAPASDRETIGRSIWWLEVYLSSAASRFVAMLQSCPLCTETARHGQELQTKMAWR